MILWRLLHVQAVSVTFLPSSPRDDVPLAECIHLVWASSNHFVAGEWMSAGDIQVECPPLAASCVRECSFLHPAKLAVNEDIGPCTTVSHVHFLVFLGWRFLNTGTHCFANSTFQLLKCVPAVHIAGKESKVQAIRKACFINFSDSLCVRLS